MSKCSQQGTCQFVQAIKKKCKECRTGVVNVAFDATSGIGQKEYPVACPKHPNCPFIGLGYEREVNND